MAKKQFKTESKKLLDMMINSIYTHKEIFLRELLSNASDAIDKLYYRSITDGNVTVSKDSLEIRLSVDKDARTIVIEDNGIGMTKEELENNLGTIAKSGSYDFKNTTEQKEDVDIIGQFGVGFYSAFMVSDEISVVSRAIDSEEAYEWRSAGVDGYTVNEAQKDKCGTIVTLHVKEDAENENYSEFLDSYRIRSLVKKYSDYLRYPIKMDVEKSVPKDGEEGQFETVVETQTLNSMIPLWKKSASEVTEEEYFEALGMEKFTTESRALSLAKYDNGAFIFEGFLGHGSYTLHYMPKGCFYPLLRYFLTTDDTSWAYDTACGEQVFISNGGETQYPVPGMRSILYETDNAYVVVTVSGGKGEAYLLEMIADDIDFTVFK